MNVTFKELGHKYYTIADDGSKIFGLSMTTFVGRFKQPYLEKFWKIYKSVQYQLQILDKKEFSAFCNEKKAGFRFYNAIKDEDERIAFFKSKMEKYVNWNSVLHGTTAIKKQWDENKENACNVGTEFHEYKESNTYDSKQELIGDRRVDLANDELSILDKTVKFSKDLSSLKDGFHPEVLLYTDKFIIDGIKYDAFLVGQVDKLYIETIRGIRYVDIDDYKTNKEIKFSNPFSKMLPPLHNLEDCDYIHYCLQTIGYAEILRQHGFVPRNIFFTHHDIKALGMTKTLNEHIGKEKVTPVKVIDLTKEFNDMIKFTFAAKIDYKRNYVSKEEKKISNEPLTIFDYDY